MARTTGWTSTPTRTPRCARGLAGLPGVHHGHLRRHLGLGRVRDEHLHGGEHRRARRPGLRRQRHLQRGEPVPRDGLHRRAEHLRLSGHPRAVRRDGQREPAAVRWHASGSGTAAYVIYQGGSANWRQRRMQAMCAMGGLLKHGLRGASPGGRDERLHHAPGLGEVRCRGGLGLCLLPHEHVPAREGRPGAEQEEVAARASLVLVHPV